MAHQLDPMGESAMQNQCLLMSGRWGFGSSLRAALILGLMLAGLTGCSSSGDKRSETNQAVGAGDTDDIRDSGPSRPPKGLASIPDAVPKPERKAKYGNPKSYVVFGKRYYPKVNSQGHVETGGASWYGRKFHGRKTSSGERYNMYAMTAAHKTLPLPTYAKVTNLENRRSVIVKINDRGPFHGNRIIDLSYAAATKLGVVQNGVAKVEVRAIDPSRPKTWESMSSSVVSANQRKQRPAETEFKKADEDGIVMGPVVVKKKPPSKTVGTSTASAASPVEPKVAASTTVPTSVSRATLYLQVGAFGNRGNAEQLRDRLVRQLQEQVNVKGTTGTSAPLYKVRIGPIASDNEAAQVSQKLAALGVSGSHRVFD